MKIVYMGSGEIGLPTLKGLLESSGHEVVAVVTQPDRPSGRGKKLAESPVKTLAKEHGVPALQPERVRRPGALEQIRACGAGLIVVFAYGQILPPELLAMPEHGCWNLHASLLPKYRGAACIQGAILDGETETGMTLMQMDVGMDTGDILLQKSLPIGPGDTTGSLHDKLAELSPSLLQEGLDKLAAGTLSAQKQDEARATTVRKLSKEMGRVDWTKTARELDCHVRAMTPWPSAFTFVPGKDGRRLLLKIHDAVLVDDSSGAPGQVLSSGEEGVIVAAGEGALLLREVQLEGKKRMPVGEFLKGYSRDIVFDPQEP